MKGFPVSSYASADVYTFRISGVSVGCCSRMLVVGVMGGEQQHRMSDNE